MENLSERLNSQPKEVLGHLKLIGKVAKELNYPVYAVGGFVRDLLLGVDDFDLDIVVEGDGINFTKELSHKLKTDFIKHKRFGTATVVTKDKIKIDVASARKEIYEQPASLPRVSPGTIKDDLARRDFSINAMALSITQANFGGLVDFFKGREDLKNKTIRILHNLSFIDDPTRILRAIRFEQRFDFKIHNLTLRLMKEALDAGMLYNVHKHRLRDEIILLLKERHPLKCIKRINKICSFGFIHPDIRLGPKKISLLAKIDKACEWFHSSFPNKRKIELWLTYLMILLEDLDSSQLHKAAQEFALRRGESGRILSFKANADDIIVKLQGSSRPSHIYRVLEPVSYEVMLLVMLRADRPILKESIENFLHHYNEVRIYAGGEDLKRLGIAPGPRYKEILKQILYEKLDRKLKTKEEELLYLKDKLLVNL